MTNKDIIAILSTPPVDMAAHMTKREHIIVELAKSILASPRLSYENHSDRLCKDAVMLADKLIRIMDGKDE